MKLNESFVLRQVSGTWVVLPLGEESVDFNGMLTLNESGAMLWNVLAQGGGREELLAALMAEYRVEQDVASTDVDAFLEVLTQVGCIEE